MWTTRVALVLWHCYIHTMLETWRPILGWEGRYEISDLGRCRTLRRTPRLLVPLRYGRYLKIQLGMRERLFLHRITWAAFNGPIPIGMTINHIDGNPANNHLSNLEMATPQEQVTHARRLGLVSPRLAGKRLLTADDIREIRYLHSEHNASYATLARHFGVVRGTIGHILKERIWRHVI